MRWREAGDQCAADAQGAPCSLSDLQQHQSQIRHEQPRKVASYSGYKPGGLYLSVSWTPDHWKPRRLLFYAHVLNAIPWMLGLKHLSDLFWHNETREFNGSKHQIGVKSILGQRLQPAWLYQTHRALPTQGSPAPTSQTWGLSLLTRTSYLALQVTC